jgi:hypothetical protein
MRRRFAGIATVMLFTGALAAPSASGVTLGDLATVDPGVCGLGATGWLSQQASTTAQYVVPTGGGVITSWSTSFGPPGAPVELVASSPFSSATPQTAVVRGVDHESLPNPIASDNVSTFTLAHPIAVQSGDLIGLEYTIGSATRCSFGGAGGDVIDVGYDAAYPGGTLTATAAGGGNLINVSVNLEQTADLGVAATVVPSAIAQGDLAELTFRVSGDPIATATFTDTLPAGLVPVSAITDDGSCGISAQVVSCALTGVPSTVALAVEGAAPGMYTDSGQIMSPLPDPNSANNSTSAPLAVVSRTPNCRVPKLRRIPLSLAEAVIRLVNCRVGKVRKAASDQVPKGDVISTKPGPGTRSPAGTKIAVRVSSG